MSNGCGCENGILKYLKPPYAKKFYVPCCMHDDEYDIGGTCKQRKLADRNLFCRCVKVVFQEESNPWKMMWLFHIILFYYVVVRLFGWNYFNYDN